MRFPHLSRPQSGLMDAVTSAWRRDEQTCVQSLLPQARLTSSQFDKAQELARRLVTDVRTRRRKASGVDALMHEFSLSSEEGIALMCLAEALLRIPDQATADRLIRDKVSRGDWASHLGKSRSLFVNAAAWGLLVTGKLVGTHGETGLSTALTRLIAKGGEPLIRKGVDLAMRMLGRQFVTGETIDEALANGREREARGYRFSYDMLGEAAMTEADARRYLDDYTRAIHAIGQASAGRGVIEGPGISVKLSAIHPRYSRAQRDRVLAELVPRLKSLMMLARQYDIGLNIDAEEADRMELSLDIVEALAFDPDLGGWDGLGIVVQAYQKRCPFIIDFLIDLARRSQRRFMVRLVKGAYWDAEIKRAQVDGQAGYPVYTRKVYTDVSYLACARKLLAAQDCIYPQFATHNALSLAAIHQLGQGKEYEFQCLHGMGETLYDQVVGAGKLDRACRIYAPVGSHETLLAYLVRRLLENGANSSFVNRIVDDAVSIDELMADPVAEAERLGGLPHPRIALPADLYGTVRRNSAGLDLANEHTLATLETGLNAAAAVTWHAAPLLAGQSMEDLPEQPVLNPADTGDQAGTVREAGLRDVHTALAAAANANWYQVTPEERARLLDNFAGLLEAHRDELMMLAVREAGKTFANALAEVREAVDFCRYYAAQLRAEFATRLLQPLGPVVCISPWNFPLAIFTGQSVAALAAGNPVLAKPAEQTPLIAALAVRLMHEAGIPRDAIQLLPGSGEVIGAALVADPRTQGVIFTGSTQVARLIYRTLAQRGGDIPLIAETGGMNAMIVDSSALPEQVVSDAITSAFDSAGQRCSALRVLYLQHDIADRVITMLKGAMDELVVGDPACLATDVGPVIDEEARQNLLAHITRIKNTARWHHTVSAPENGTFVAPFLCEISSIRELKQEVFGPVLHVIRFSAHELPQVLNDVRTSGYGLTMGLHSRIDETINLVSDTAAVGNLYVNRNIVGAIVGVQPFGGEGLSGTGPKAGGPDYLYRLCRGGQLLRETAQSEARAPLDELAALLPVILADDTARQRQAGWLAEASRQSQAGYRIALPGPTGEINYLAYVPRGRVMCFADSREALVAQLIAILATGNIAILSADSVAAVEAGSLPGSLGLSIGNSLDGVDAVLFSGEQTAADALRQQLASLEGPVILLNQADGAGRYDLHRLVHERAVSINTTAAGGNASLMSLED